MLPKADLNVPGEYRKVKGPNRLIGAVGVPPAASLPARRPRHYYIIDVGGEALVMSARQAKSPNTQRRERFFCEELTEFWL
ncbi:MAG: hypothetical protein BMS9Abin04_265 [Planctomycetia bacterium]|nr:MAG: hypothetical protein BMS9Abin04_265 [Planctomycetia bacterium]